jgi:polyhydroxyalkanoate synthase
VPAEDTATGGAGGAEAGATTDLSAGGDSASGDGGGDEGGTGTRLTEINGIGPAYEARLQALGIGSFEDLMNADAASLAEQLGVIGGQATVEDWIAQARQLTAGDGDAADGGA